jgi:ATP-dependent HslUV protease ATP-binding subunit HslU
LRDTDSSLLKQYAALLAADGLALSFTDDAVEALAASAMELNRRLENIGARRLQTLMARLLDEILYAAPEGTPEAIVIDRAYVQQRLADLVEDEDLSRYIL